MTTTTSLSICLSSVLSNTPMAQRLDVWDTFEEFSEALSPERCPVLEEFYMDLTLDCDDVKSLAK